MKNIIKYAIGILMACSLIFTDIIKANPTSITDNDVITSAQIVPQESSAENNATLIEKPSTLFFKHMILAMKALKLQLLICDGNSNSLIITGRTTSKDGKFEIITSILTTLQICDQNFQPITFNEPRPFETLYIDNDILDIALLKNPIGGMGSKHLAYAVQVALEKQNLLDEQSSTDDESIVIFDETTTGVLKQSSEQGQWAAICTTKIPVDDTTSIAHMNTEIMLKQLFSNKGKVSEFIEAEKLR